MIRACDAHSLVLLDETPREVNWCPRCKAWLCEECRKNWNIRGRAFFERRKQKMVAFVRGLLGGRAA